jgi:hypothetical protein
MSLVESIERGLARVPWRLEFPAEPLREVHLRVHIVYFAIDMPIGGVTLRIPVSAMITMSPPDDGTTKTNSQPATT